MNHDFKNWTTDQVIRKFVNDIDLASAELERRGVSPNEVLQRLDTLLDKIAAPDDGAEAAEGAKE